MSNTEIEIVVDDPTAPEPDSPAVTDTRVAEAVVCVMLLGLAALLGYDNWRTGAGWDSTGPQAGYFPFYLSVILGGASLYGLVAAAITRKQEAETFLLARYRRSDKTVEAGAAQNDREIKRKITGLWAGRIPANTRAPIVIAKQHREAQQQQRCHDLHHAGVG